MHLTQEQTIKGYWEKVKDQYPDLTYDQFFDICQTPAKFTTECIRDNNLPRIHLKRLGDFEVFPKRIIKKLKELEVWKEKGIVTEEQYEIRKTFLLKYQEDLRKHQIDKETTEPNIEIIDDVTKRQDKEGDQES